jgi:uncharacterized membrane protein YhaH (DUF805 family)
VRTADIFLSFEGRLDRERWLGAAALFVFLVLATYAATWLLARNGAISFAAREAIRTFVQIALLVPWFALDWKRFQDLGVSGRWAMICPGLIIVSRILEWPGIGGWLGPAYATLASVVAWAQLAVALWLAYALACRSGTEGSNAYGADSRAAVDPNAL